MADLSSTDAVTRESAIARLAVIGPRAIDRLGRLIQSRTTAPVRAAALRALEAIDDPRALDTALTAIDDINSSVSIAAIAIARRIASRESRSTRGALKPSGWPHFAHSEISIDGRWRRC